MMGAEFADAASNLEGKVALITGGGAGIGRASAMLLASHGAKVAIADLDIASAEACAHDIVRMGGEAIGIACDVADEAGVAAMMETLLKAFGHLDMAFNNAGISPLSCKMTDLTLDQWDRVLSINARGTWLCMREEVFPIAAAGGGSIVNMASFAGIRGVALHSAYAASKHAVVGLTRSAALEYAPQNIRVNALCPGVVHTELIERAIAALPPGERQAALDRRVALHPLGRLAEAEDIALAALFLLSGQSRFITGQILPVDGGWTAD